MKRIRYKWSQKEDGNRCFKVTRETMDDIVAQKGLKIGQRAEFYDPTTDWNDSDIGYLNIQDGRIVIKLG